MRTVVSIAVMSLLAGAASSAGAYSFSPIDTFASLKGTLTLYPTSGTPFKCKVFARVFTGKGTPFRDLPRIISISTTSHLGPCNSVEFEGVPAGVVASGAHKGSFGGGGWLLPARASCTITQTTFYDKSSGVWTIPVGNCVSGSLTSKPPVTIVP
jgi:hypothetical protein